MIPSTWPIHIGYISCDNFATNPRKFIVNVSDRINKLDVVILVGDAVSIDAVSTLLPHMRADSQTRRRKIMTADGVNVDFRGGAIVCNRNNACVVINLDPFAVCGTIAEKYVYSADKYCGKVKIFTAAGVTFEFMREYNGAQYFRLGTNAGNNGKLPLFAIKDSADWTIVDESDNQYMKNKWDIALNIYHNITHNAPITDLVARDRWSTKMPAWQSPARLLEYLQSDESLRAYVSILSIDDMPREILSLIAILQFRASIGNLITAYKDKLFAQLLPIINCANNYNSVTTYPNKRIIIRGMDYNFTEYINYSETDYNNHNYAFGAIVTNQPGEENRNYIYLDSLLCGRCLQIKMKFSRFMVMIIDACPIIACGNNEIILTISE